MSRALAAAPAPTRSRTDVAVRRLLRLPPDGPRGSEDSARRAFSTSIFVSATRCLLTYIVLPFVAPALGLATGVGPIIGIVIGIVAIVFNVASIRRFWRADHRYRWAFTAISLTVIGMLLVFLVRDIVELVA